MRSAKRREGAIDQMPTRLGGPLGDDEAAGALADIKWESYGFLFFLSFGCSENNSQASTTKPIATPAIANHVPSFSIVV